MSLTDGFRLPEFTEFVEKFKQYDSHWHEEDLGAAILKIQEFEQKEEFYCSQEEMTLLLYLKYGNNFRDQPIYQQELHDRLTFPEKYNDWDMRLTNAKYRLENAVAAVINPDSKKSVHNKQQIKIINLIRLWKKTGSSRFLELIKKWGETAMKDIDFMYENERDPIQKQAILDARNRIFITMMSQ